MVDREREARLAGVLQELPCLVGIVGVAVVLRGVAVGADRARRVENGRRRREDVLHDRLAVDGVVQRLAHPFVLEWPPLRVQVDPDDARRGRRVDSEVAVPGESCGVLGWHVKDQVHVAALEGQQACRDVGIGPGDDRADLRAPAPVLIVGLEPDFLTSLVMNELVRPGAHRCRVEILVAHLLSKYQTHYRGVRKQND